VYRAVALSRSISQQAALPLSAPAFMYSSPLPLRLYLTYQTYICISRQPFPVIFHSPLTLDRVNVFKIPTMTHGDTSQTNSHPPSVKLLRDRFRFERPVVYTIARATTTAGIKTFPKSASFMLIRATKLVQRKGREKERSVEKGANSHRS